jgi:hypothetical protein
MDRKHQGARSELLACAWLLAEGYEVFRNISQHGHADIIALKDGKAFYFDVKTSRMGRNNPARRLSSKQVAEGILPLVVTGAGECSIDWSPSLENPLRTPRICDQCGESFLPAVRHQRFCSQRCSNDYHHGTPRTPRICDQCGESFLPRKEGVQRFCSKQCRTNYHDWQRQLRARGLLRGQPDEPSPATPKPTPIARPYPPSHS